MPYSYGVSMKHKDGWKLVYSGDTMPSQRLVSGGTSLPYLFSYKKEVFTLLKQSQKSKSILQSKSVNSRDTLPCQQLIDGGMSLFIHL